jgi:hypothetical protein
MKLATDHLSCGAVHVISKFQGGRSDNIYIGLCKYVISEIACVVVGLERDPLSLVSTTEELLDRKVAAPVEKTERIRPEGSVTLPTWHPLSAQVGNRFADERRSLGRLADSDHGV